MYLHLSGLLETTKDQNNFRWRFHQVHQSGL
uniref:Uncharacterized protein n=1 Tax=Arundo donax TaxID=35708 RepID=A0A0A8ZY40_ARUDO